MKIMNETKNSLFVSIHQNSFANSQLWGTQVFYSPNTTASPELADSIQSYVKNMLQPDNKRVVKKSGNSIYLLYYAKKTAVLVERIHGIGKDICCNNIVTFITDFI